MIRLRLLLAIPLFFLSCKTTIREELPADAGELIRINQIGYYPDAPKLAAVKGELYATEFFLIDAYFKDTVFSGKLSTERESQFSGTITHIADFSAVKDTGSFVLLVPGLGKSFPFEIKEKVFYGLAQGVIKGFYFQRASTDLPESFAGKWARKEGHPDTAVLIHASAATVLRPEGTIIAAPKGWYDAGDYNKYIVNSGISVGTMLSLYEDFPDYFNHFSVNIPEKDNTIPDLLDEVLWNLRWMLTMQDPNDGGVYHKLTTADFEGMVEPAVATAPRYVVQKSTTATLDFAAVMAQSARIFKKFEDELPGLSDSCRAAAEYAWKWALKNPAQLYDQQKLNKSYSPAISTGTYGDRDASDEWIWAAAELWVTTRDQKYFEKILVPDRPLGIPSWPQVQTLGYYSILRHKDEFGFRSFGIIREIEEKLIALADSLQKNINSTAYATVMGGSVRDFGWGSNSLAANQGIALVQAYLLTDDKKYLQAALSNIDYLLGRNATGYAYVTGYGNKSPRHPHHRPSASDGVEAPVPGLLVGGGLIPGNRTDAEVTLLTSLMSLIWTKAALMLPMK